MDRKHEWNYLFGMIRYGLSGGTPPEIDGVFDWHYLYRLCKYHRIEAMVCSGLEKLPAAEQPPEEIRKRLQEAADIGKAREAVQHFALGELLDAFESEGVACLPLKGILLKQFYPRPDLRMMADLDILYRPEQEGKLDEILLGLGYDCDHKDDHHKVYFRQPFMNVEMHFRLVSGNDRYASYYDSMDIWERAGKEEGRRCLYRLSWEDYYVFMLVHMAKHFQNGGSGIRSIVDIWQFMEKMEGQLDWAYIRGELRKLRLEVFEQKVRELSDIWFKGGESTALYDEMTERFVGSGSYGTKGNYYQQRVAAASADKSLGYGQFRVWLSAVFLPFEDMKRQYPYLGKCPVLLPAAWVQRILRTCFRRKGRASEVLSGMKTDTIETQKWKVLFEKLDLQ